MVVADDHSITHIPPCMARSTPSDPLIPASDPHKELWLTLSAHAIQLTHHHCLCFIIGQNSLTGSCLLSGSSKLKVHRRASRSERQL